MTNKRTDNNGVFTVKLQSTNGKLVPVNHKQFESLEEATKYARSRVASGSYRDYEIVNEARKSFRDLANEYEKLTGKKAPPGTSTQAMQIILDKAKREMTTEAEKFDPDYYPEKDMEKIVKNRQAQNKQIRDVQNKAKSKVSEGVLDDHDDDGFMAKRQLYDLAKYATQLHRMIQDTDNLEPWVQAKITKAADYIDSVKHYIEYNNARTELGYTEPRPALEGKLNEAMKLDKENIIHPMPGTEKFARQYRAGMIGDYRSGGPTPKDEANSNKFWTLYDAQTVRHGFAGSGTVQFTNKKTGEVFIVDKTPNGMSFHGTDHDISSAGIAESAEQLNEISDKLKRRYLGKAVQKQYDFFTEPLDPNDPETKKWLTPKGRLKKGYYDQPHKVKARDKYNRRSEIIDKTAKKVTGKPHYSRMSTMTDPGVTGQASDWHKGKKYSKTDETTSAGGIAAVAQPLGKMQKRRKK